jgi:hypothetical protein
MSTPDRAISILTNDVSAYIRSIEGGYGEKGGYRDGDLGENVWFKELACPTSRLVKGIVLLQKGGKCDVWDQC